MGLKIDQKMHVMDIDENAPTTLQTNNSKHNIFVYVWEICFAGHEFDVFNSTTKIPLNIFIITMNLSQHFYDACCIL